jgi:hypothetical protein
VKLKHPDSKKQIEVSDEQAPMYLSQGWQQPQPKASKGSNG